MKPFIRAQLERSVQRLSELDFLLSREDIMQDMTQFMVLSREHAVGIPAIVRAVFPFGGAIRVELAVEGYDMPIQVEVPRAFFEAGEVQVNSGLFVRATNARVFPQFN